MRTIKKTVACLVAVLMVLSACSAAFTASATASGTCGENLTWAIANGVLSIFGTGAMDNYAPPGDNTPWAQSGESYSSIVISSGVTSVGEWAFGYSPATSVSIPNTVTSIGSGAFSGSGLTSVTIPGSVTSWQEAFVLCTSLTSATIESGVELIDVMSFGGCSSLTSVTIPTSVTAIGQAAFQMCSNLASISLPWNLETIGDSAFADTALTDVLIPNTVNTIGEEAFSGTPLTTFAFPPTLSTISYGVLGGCSDLESVAIPSSVTQIGDYAFSDCFSLATVYYASTQQDWNEISIGSDNDPLLAANLICSETPDIHPSCGDNVTWSIENNVLTISGTGAMYDYGEAPYFVPGWAYESVTSVVIGSGVTHIGGQAFQALTSLTSVTISNTVTSISEQAFCGCNSLANLTLGSGLVSIGRLAFSDCDGLTSLTIPNSVTTLGDYAFQQCSNLATLTIGTGVTNLGYGTFQECVALTTINYNAVNVSDPSSSPYLFVGMPDASTHVTVNVGSGVQRIPAYLFWIYMPGYGPNIETVNIPVDVTAVGHDAFYNCTTITDVNYGGTQQQWNAITIGSNNDPLTNATLHCTASPAEPADTYSLSIGDQVAVNLMIDLAARNLEVSDVSITMDGQPVETSVTNDGDQYCFTIITAPAQIADEIVITVGDEIITTTVMDYCVALCGHEYDAYEKEQNLAKAILHYGKAANDWFDWTDETITTFGELNHQPVQDYTGAKFTDSTHQITSASFMALAKPEFRFYMSGVTEAQAAAYNSAGITAAYRDTNNTEELHARFKKAVKDGQTVVLVEVTGVSAENMNEEVVVNIPGLGQFTFNGNAFAKAMANDDDPVTKNFGAALYNYGVAANTCFKPASQEDQP